MPIYTQSYETKHEFLKIDNTDFIHTNDPIIHRDIIGFMDWACKKMRYYYGFSQIVESPCSTLDTLLRSVNNQNTTINKFEIKKIVMVCNNANLFTPHIFTRDIDNVDMMIDIIKESYYLGCNMVTLDPGIARLNTASLMEKLTNKKNEQNHIDQLSKLSIPMAKVFSYILWCIKKEVVRGIRSY